MTNREAIEDLRGCIGCGVYKGTALMAIKALEEQDKRRWIPVSERLPEDNQRIIATFEDGNIYQVNFSYFLHENSEYAHGNNIIAWMPLPSPYTD